MPQGKPAGVRCIQLDAQERCRIFDQPERPAVCGQLMPSHQMCGNSRDAALSYLAWLERATEPASNIRTGSAEASSAP